MRIRPLRRAAMLALACTLLQVGGPGVVTAAEPTLGTAVVQDGLVIPWDVAFTPAGQMLVTERPGRVRVYASGATDAPLVRTVVIPGVRAEAEAGLMGIAVDVAHATNGFVFVCASRDVAGAWRNEVMRYRVAADGTWTDELVIVGGMLASARHNGCALEMDATGKLWVGMGDAGTTALAQDPDSLNGKVLRVERDGSVPADNPILPGAGGRSAVYSLGHRNPQGIAFRPGTGQVYAVEHGPDRDDEVNLLQAGGNYGWPCYTGDGVPFAPAGCASASAYDAPAWASGDPTLATSGATFVTGEAWRDWSGDLFVSTLKEADLRRMKADVAGSTVTSQQILFNGAWSRLRAAVSGPRGELYLTTSTGSNDRVIVVAPTVTPFTDIAGSPFKPDIEWVYTAGITSGCTATTYCPDGFVTREQMASFLARALKLSGTAPDAFTDDEQSIHEPNINLVAKAGIATGCAATKYCPTALVSREQMASFLARALKLAGSAPDAFTDDEQSIHEPNINLVAREGVATGCGNNKYCPTANVTRGQMAAFLHRAFGP